MQNDNVFWVINVLVMARFVARFRAKSILNDLVFCENLKEYLCHHTQMFSVCSNWCKWKYMKYHTWKWRTILIFSKLCIYISHAYFWNFLKFYFTEILTKPESSDCLNTAGIYNLKVPLNQRYRNIGFQISETILKCDEKFQREWS